MIRPGRNRRGTSKRPFTPKSVPGLNLWLDNSLVTLNGSTVSAWPDLSGAGNNFAQANPALQPNYIASETDFPTAQPAVKFNVADNVLAAAGAFSIRWVAVVAVYPATTFANFHGLFTASAADDRRALVGSIGTANWLTDGLAGNRFRDGIDTDVALTTANAPHLYIHTFDASETWTWQVGKDRGNAGRQWTDSVCLVLAGSSALSSADMTRIQAYCRSRGMIP